MTRWLPSPLASASLLATWLLLNQSLSAGHVIVGGVLALVGPRVLAALDLPAGAVRRPGAIARLSLRVATDVVRSNIAVARLVLGPRRRRRSGFVAVPLTLRNPYGLAVLACIITATPGTVWVGFDAARGILVIHVFDLIDEAEWVRIITHRYERPLREIFE
ncbi:MAG TPA: Na+/H+ antiporter subunit E [Thermodesulfobacteriota bacterium]